MCRISPISDDWVVKGCHLHVGKVEVVLRPDHLGGIVCRKVFSTTADWEIEAASKEIRKALEDPEWRGRLKGRLEGAMDFLLGVEGRLYPKARGRLREFRMLVVALGRLEAS
jgi:hypothetical protein